MNPEPCPEPSILEQDLRGSNESPLSRFRRAYGPASGGALVSAAHVRAPDAEDLPQTCIANTRTGQQRAALCRMEKADCSELFHVDLAESVPNFTGVKSPTHISLHKSSTVAQPDKLHKDSSIKSNDMPVDKILKPVHPTFIERTHAQLSTAGGALMDCPAFPVYMQESTAHTISSKSIDYFECTTPQPPSELNMSPDITTSVTMQTSPNGYTQQIIQREIHDTGFGGHCNFFRIDMDTGANQSGAVKNFKEARTVHGFRMALGDLEDVNRNHKKFSEARGATLMHHSQPLFDHVEFSCQKRQFSKPDVARIGELQSQDLINHGLRGSRHCAWAPPQAQVNAATQKVRPQPIPRIECNSPQRKQQASFCWSCGGRILGHFQFCIYCGCNLRNSTAVQLQ